MNLNSDQMALYRNSGNIGSAINQSQIRTANGVFHSGMTINDAKMIGREKCFFRRDFSDVDKNKDGILSNDEILKERDNEVKRLRADALVMGAFGVYDAIGLTKHLSLWNLAFTGLFTAFTIDSIVRSNKLSKANDDLKQQLSINA